MSVVRLALLLGGLLTVLIGCTGADLASVAPSSAGPAATEPAPGTATDVAPPRAVPAASPAHAAQDDEQRIPEELGPAPVAQRTPGPTVATASRVVVEAYGIDLPVVSSGLDIPDNEAGYPLCDVAQYLQAYRQPAQAGTTYLYAHARAGMFLPLLEASERDDGRELVGLEVVVYTTDATAHSYEIFAVNRHATDYLLADRVPPGEHRLVLQTSEGPRGVEPKLQLAARLTERQPTTPDAALPVSRPRPCA